MSTIIHTKQKKHRINSIHKRAKRSNPNTDVSARETKFYKKNIKKTKLYIINSNLRKEKTNKLIEKIVLLLLLL